MQASANSNLRRRIDSAEFAAFFSICGTIITALVCMVIFRPNTPTWEDLKQTSWWNWIGGPLGVIFVFAGATLTEKLGAAAFIALVVGGQLACSLVFDHFALMGLPEKAITPQRLLGAALVVAGVVCIKYL